MKKIYFLSFIFVVITSCSVNEKPIFLRLGEVKLVSVSRDSVKFKTIAFFKNENDIGGKISTDKIQVFVENNPVANVKTEEFDVPANTEFEIPLNVSVPYDKVISKGMLGGLVNSVLNKGVTVKFQGDINYRILGIKSSYAVVQESKLKIN